MLSFSLLSVGEGRRLANHLLGKRDESHTFVHGMCVSRCVLARCSEGVLAVSRSRLAEA